MSLERYPLVADWLTVKGDRFELRTGKVDIGQRISTGLCRIVAGELGLDPGDIDVAPVTTKDSPDEGITSGSNSIEQSGRALRLAAATLRDAVLATASEMLETDAAVLRDGLIVNPRSNRTLRPVDIAKTIDPALPVNPDAPFLVADPPVQRPPRGMRGMVDGSYRFIQDLTVPGMLHARTIRPPHRNARLADVDVAALGQLERESVHIVRDGSFLAVVGEREYPIVRAAERLALACQWDSRGGLDERSVFDLLVEQPRMSMRVEEGLPVTGALPDPLDAPTLAARYERPYQLHGSLAPSAALVEFRAGRLSIWSHSQGIYPLRESIAEALGLAMGDIEVTHCPSSGCYGHNGADDAAFEAALIALALPEYPILLKWTRQDEHTWEPAAPAMVVDIAAKLEDGRISAWSQQAYSDTHRGRPRPGPHRAGPSRFAAAQLLNTPESPYAATPNMGRHAGLHRNLDPIYEVADKRLTKHLVPDLPLRTSAMRCLGGAANVFAIESMMDELAVQANCDPIAFRRSHLTDPRAIQLLDAVESHQMWRSEKAEDSGRGMAYAQYKNVMTRAAVLVDLCVDDTGEVRLERALIVADAGRVIDPAGLRAQLEGGFIQAASWCLCEKFQYDRDGPICRDWESYPVIRFDAIPEVETVLLCHDDKSPLGAGEAACGPTLAAIANAIHDATGLRLRRLPFRPDALTEAALSQ